MITNLKPHRPFGLTLAILLCLVVFVFIPLLPLFFVLMTGDITIQVDGEAMVGVDILGISNIALLLQAIVPMSLGLLAILTWLGRPRWIRQIFRVAILIVGIGLIGLLVFSLTRTPDLASGLDSATAASGGVTVFYIVVLCLVTLYTVWYLGRWPVKAFFRGHYTAEDIHRLKALYPDAEFPAEIESVRT